MDRSWSDWLDGLAIHHEVGGETVLSGSLRDQAALHGVLTRLHDLGVELLAVNTVEPPDQKGGT